MQKALQVLRRVDAKWWFVLGFFLMCCAYEAGRVLNIRPQPHHLWRQTDCISLAWNYYDTTWNLFKPAIHNQFADGHASGRSAGEFPLLYYVVGITWRITGPSEFLYRLIVLLIHFVGSLALFGAVRRITNSGSWAAMVALLFFSSPVIVYFSISFLTDVPALDMALIGWWYLVRYVQERRRSLWTWSVAFFSLAMLLKVTAGMSLVAISGVLILETLFSRGKSREADLFPHRRFAWTALLIGYAMVYAWYAYAAWYNGVHGAKYTFNDLWPIWIMTPEAMDWAWRTGCDIIVFQVFDTSVWVLLGTAFVSLVLNARQFPWRAWVLVLSLIVGSALYTILWFNALQDHDYYFINPMITLVVLLVAFLWWLGRQHPDILRARWAQAGMGVLLVLNVAYAAQNMQMRYDTSGRMTARSLWPIYHEAELAYWNGLDYWGMGDLPTIEPRLRELGVRKEDKVIFLDDQAINSALVLMGNRGWTGFGLDLLALGRIDELITHGAHYLLFTERKWLDDPRLASYLTAPVAQVGGVRIFDLTGQHRPMERQLVFQQDQGRPLHLTHRLDTVPCPSEEKGWCFLPSEYPLDVDGLPMYGAGVAYAELFVTGTMHWQKVPGAKVAELLLAEDDERRQLSLSGYALKEGPFAFRYGLPPRADGARTKLFISNPSGCAFALDGLKLEVVRYLEPGKAMAMGSSQ